MKDGDWWIDDMTAEQKLRRGFMVKFCDTETVIREISIKYL